MKKISSTLSFLLFVLVACAQSTVTYTPDPADFANPERGFYRYSETYATPYTPLNAADLAAWRSLHQPPSAGYSIYSTLTFRYFVLEDFTGSAISQTYLNNMTADFAAARTAGVKIIPRFAYTITPNAGSCGSFICPPYGDAPKAIVLQHIGQIAPILEANKDVIAAVQMGFIGTWGENYYTDFFGDASNAPFKLTDTNWNDRNEVLGALLAAVPAERTVQVRYPQLKQRYVYGINAPTSAAALTAAEAFDGSDKARIGFHNDCFLASPDDFGTYFDYGNSSTSAVSDTAALKPYTAADSRYVPAGGETCNDFDPASDCSGTSVGARADFELRRLHYSYLNSQFNNDVNNDWMGICLDDIKRELGYRFVLQSGTYSDAAQPGQTISVALTLQNEGYAAPFNPRGVELVLRNQTTDAVWLVRTADDPRLWLRESNPITLGGEFCIPPAMPTGTYDLLLHLPDPEASLYARPEYAIRLANTGVWEGATGYNDLQHSIVIDNSATRPACTDEPTFALTSAFLPVSLLGFTATANEQNIDLNWMTETELNNAGFGVERSPDAQNFTEITFVNGAGTTDEPQDYAYTDTEVTPGQTYFYRLAQTDTDGTVTYSPVVSAQLLTGTANRNSLAEKIHLYPNPARGKVFFENKTGVVFPSVTVRDIAGRAVHDADLNDNFVLLPSVRAGVYFLEFAGENGVLVVKRVGVW